MDTPIATVISGAPLDPNLSHITNTSMSRYTDLVAELDMLIKHNSYLQLRISYLEDSLKAVLQKIQ